TYIPRPEWYFLFLFQTLKLFEGPLEVLGSMILPAAAVLALFLIPFIDRAQMAKLRHRTTAMAAVALAAIAWTGLTTVAIATTPKDSEVVIDYSGPTDWMELSPEEMAGIGYFRKENCESCHTVGEGKPKMGPDLTQTATRKSAAWMIQHFKRPASLVPGSVMPPLQLNDGQLNALAAFLLKLTPRNAAALQSAPPFAVEGALVYQANKCGVCHLVNEVGGKLGPPLDGLSKRRTRTWVERHFLEPQVMSPKTIMPVYKFSPKDMENITTYLFVLD
ncbi:MAG: c-type cytochrome, partial [Bryobacteraceae bacterium]